ncbi:MAG: alpha/beta hydrolase [Chryseosolibacter sp.]
MSFTRNIFMTALSALLFFSCTEERFIDEAGNLVPKTVDEDASLPSITVNGARLHAEAFGPPDSTIVVCIHGGPGGDYRYLLNTKDLADHGYRVVLYDQRGSGLSQRFSKKSYTNLGLGALDVLYNELSGVIAYYRTSPNQKVFLLGHSWGAILATRYAGKYPTAVQGLVVCEPGGLLWEDIKEFVKESRSFGLFGELLNDATYLDQFITGKEDEHEILDYKSALMVSKNDITGDELMAPGSFWRSGAVINVALFELGEDYEPDFSEGISNFNVPVILFYSEKNKAYPDSWAQRISSAYNAVELFKITGVGHDGIIKDKTAWTNQTLPEILAYFDSL